MTSARVHKRYDFSVEKDPWEPEIDEVVVMCRKRTYVNENLVNDIGSTFQIPEGEIDNLIAVLQEHKERKA